MFRHVDGIESSNIEEHELTVNKDAGRGCAVAPPQVPESFRLDNTIELRNSCACVHGIVVVQEVPARKGKYAKHQPRTRRKDKLDSNEAAKAGSVFPWGLPHITHQASTKSFTPPSQLQVSLSRLSQLSQLSSAHAAPSSSL